MSILLPAERGRNRVRKNRAHPDPPALDPLPDLPPSSQHCSSVSSSSKGASMLSASTTWGSGSAARASSFPGDGDQQHREGRRRRRRLCTLAVVAAYSAALLPSGTAFVVPSVPTPANTATLSPEQNAAHVSDARLGVSSVGGQEGRARRAARRRRTPVGCLRMVAMEPRVDMSPAATITTTTVAPARPPGKEGPHLPWTGSMAGPEFPLTYMPFMEHMLNVLARSFGQMTALPLSDRLAFVTNIDKEARMLSMCFTSPEVRKVRLTYFDAGDKVQVLNAVIYPDPSLDMPLLGVDLISFGGKHLAGIDFQPLFDDDACRSRYSQKLAPIKAKYPEFAQKMSPRFYDSARFFSEEMLFGRYEDESIVGSKLFPAFDEYLSLYISDLLEASAGGGDPSPDARARVLDRHRAYDQYNAERDPAHGLFRNYFGEAFSEDFMDNFLFELSTRPAGGYPRGGALANGGGRGKGADAGGRPPSGVNPNA